jgi:hypothetical protein
MNRPLKTNTKDALLIILICGTVWGCVEAGLGLLPKYPFSSVPPTLIGLMVLALVRTYLPKPGSSTAIGAIAMLYRAMTAHGWPCHIWAVLLIGVSFDVVATLLARKNERLAWRIVSGPATAYLAYALFGFTMTYIMLYIPLMKHCAHWWVIGGLPKILNYIGKSGSLAAVGSTVFVPLGYWLGSLTASIKVSQRWAMIGAGFILAALWILGFAIFP